MILKDSSELQQQLVDRLVETYKPEAIWLFGSQAWGQPDESSDVDVLIIINSSDETKTDRARKGLRAMWSLQIPLDLLVLTKAELAERVSQPGSLSHQIITKGQCLYEAA